MKRSKNIQANETGFGADFEAFLCQLEPGAIVGARIEELPRTGRLVVTPVDSIAYGKWLKLAQEQNRVGAMDGEGRACFVLKGMSSYAQVVIVHPI